MFLPSTKTIDKKSEGFTETLKKINFYENDKEVWKKIEVDKIKDIPGECKNLMIWRKY